MSASLSCELDQDTASTKSPYTPPIPFLIDSVEKNTYQQRLHHYFDSILLSAPSNFNGGIVVAKGGTILYEKYQGFEDPSKKTRPITAGSSFHIASTTKPFTAIAILGLVDQGKLSLTDTITRFFPALPYPFVTVHDLLTHRSGLPNYLHFMQASGWDKKKMATNQDVLQVMISERPACLAAPDSRFEYCNTNYVLLALILEKIVGMSYPDYLQQVFFKRLGMSHTFVFQPRDTSRIVYSYQQNGMLWPLDYLDLTYGDKNIYSTPQDLLKWDQALYTDQLIDTSLLQEAFTGTSFERPGTHNYGLGFRLEMLPNSKKVIYHFGRWHGNNAVFTRLVDEKVTIVILGNRFNRAIYTAAYHSYALFGNYQTKVEKGQE